MRLRRDGCTSRTGTPFARRWSQSRWQAPNAHHLLAAREGRGADAQDAVVLGSDRAPLSATKRAVPGATSTRDRSGASKRLSASDRLVGVAARRSPFGLI